MGLDEIQILIPPHILLSNASYAVGMLHGALHARISVIFFAILHKHFNPL